MLALVLEHESIQLLTLWSYLNALGAYMLEEVRLGVQSRKRTVSQAELIKNNQKTTLFYLGGRHSSVVSSAPTILQPQV